jgi:hypothetical protein
MLIAGEAMGVLYFCLFKGSMVRSDRDHDSGWGMSSLLWRTGLRNHMAEWSGSWLGRGECGFEVARW